MKKATEKETRRSCKKRGRDFFFLKKCQARRRVNTRRVDRENEHQEGTHKERKHENSQNKEKKKRET